MDCFRKALDWTGDRPLHLALLLRYHPEARVKFQAFADHSLKRKLELEDDGEGSSKGAKRVKLDVDT